jgi:pyridoxine 5'-phosphate synthase PdxJ
VTARRDTEDNRETIANWMKSHGIDLYTHFSALGSKVEHMAKIGLKVDIWIDDDPKRCALGH